MSPAAVAVIIQHLERYPNPTCPVMDQFEIKRYQYALETVPDTALESLEKAICRQEWQFRPQPGTLFELWRSLSRSEAHEVTSTVEQLLTLRQKYGEYGAPMKGYETNYPGIRDLGPPFEVVNNALLSRVVRAMSGDWVAFCQDDSPSGVFRGQLLKVAAQVLEAEDDPIRDLRQELAASAVAQIEAPKAAQLPAKPLMSLKQIVEVAKSKGNLCSEKS